MKNYKKFLESIHSKLHPIFDINKYLSRMGKGIDDKLFFLDFINPNTIVDFGCADGTVLDRINELYPDINLIGYDNEPELYGRNTNPNIIFTDNWETVIDETKNENDVCLLLSSVIHEVYSYSTPRQIEIFWENAFNSGFKWIAIRDMMPKNEYDKYSYNLEDINKIKAKYDPYYLKSFEEHWGDIGVDVRTLMHFFLKYSYIDNWDSEVNENYVPITLEELKALIPPNWRIIYENHFLPDFLKVHIKNDFEINYKEPTHLKMIIVGSCFCQ